MASEYVNPQYLEKIKQRQEVREASFEELKKLHKLNENAQQIVKLPVHDLLSKLQSGQLTATTVLSAYTAKALEVTERCNCVTEFNPKASELARNLDEKVKNKDASLGPLHGLPVAIKDDQDLEGMDTTMGFAKNLNKPAKESAVIVKVLMNLGAVPFCKTNLPQSILSFGSDNPIYGIVKNGLRASLAPGGSSSGSGSLVGGGGAPIATGSDLGGSLRCPSHYHGLASMRGTTNRLSEKGMVEAIPVITQRGVPGIIAPDAKTLAFLWKCLTEDNRQNELDPAAVPIPWNEKLFSSQQKLRIGYYTSLPFLPAFMDTQKTVLAARDALMSAGHKLVPFQMPDDSNYVKVIYDHIFGEQGKWLLEKFDGEPLAVSMRDFVLELRSLAEKSKEKQATDAKRILSGLVGEEGKTGEELMNSIYQKRALTLDIFGRMEKAEVDLILSPAFPHPAVKLDFGHRSMGAVVYTMIWNFVDFPTGVVRFGTETPASVLAYDDKGDANLKAIKEALTDSVGMPINVQIIGQPFKEELVLRALCEIERLRLLTEQ